MAWVFESLISLALIILLGFALHHALRFVRKKTSEPGMRAALAFIMASIFNAKMPPPQDTTEIAPPRINNKTT